MSLVDDALAFAARAHDGVLRKYGDEPYIVHPQRVAATLAALNFDDEVIAAALLHDVVEDCGVAADELAQRFGDRVARLVLEVTDLSRPEDGNRRIRKAKDRDHLAAASADGQSIKFADLIDNVRDIVEHDRSFAKVFVRETQDLYSVLTKGHPDLRQRLSEVLAMANDALARSATGRR
jgi:(p)ppGpp synthase/HD superfamily hydrolase